jgi:hypothetical protein
MTPYEIVYGKKPMLVASYVPTTSKFHALDKTLHTGEAITHILKDNLIMVQNQMKQHIDQHKYECSFNGGDQLFLHLQPYKQTSIKDKVP